MTVLSQGAFDRVMQISTAEEAMSWLKTYHQFRILPDRIHAFLRENGFGHSDQEIIDLLIDTLAEYHPGKRDTIRKTVRPWFEIHEGIDSRTISREYAFDVCFALKLNMDQSEDFITSLTGAGINYHDIEELTKIYALSVEKSYADCEILLTESKKAAAIQNKNSIDDESVVTDVIKSEIKTLHNDNEFLNFIRNNGNIFIESQVTAHDFFFGMMSALLGKPYKPDEKKEGHVKEDESDSDAPNVKQIVKDNLFRRFVRGRGNTKLGQVIYKEWPNETQLSRMRNGEIKITRKVLILLFLATGGEFSGFEESKTLAEHGLRGVIPVEESEFDSDFEGMYEQMNAMLTECGFSKIDPRHPFDWFVLFCMATGDVFDFDQRSKNLLSLVFGNDTQL